MHNLSGLAFGVPIFAQSDDYSGRCFQYGNKINRGLGPYFGVPAKKIKNRRRNILELEKEYLAEQLNDSGTGVGEKNY
jgi:hypothetical protein